MKKAFVFLLVFCVFISFNIPLTHAANEGENDLSLENTSSILPLVDQNVVNVLEENNIDFHIEDGYRIQLDQPSVENIANVNNLLEEDMNTRQGINVLATYPTAWNPMENFDRVTSKKFTKATKTAFVTALTGWLGGITGGAVTLAKLAGAGFGGYYFIESDTENIYSFSKYSYRELGPGKVGPTGSYMGDYEIQKKSIVTKSASGTGGDSITRTNESTILEPFF